MNIKIIEQSVELPLSRETVDDMVYAAERMGRLCYRSEPKGEPTEFLSRIIGRGHESVIEHISISAMFITDRAATHQLIRHRHASYSQESQRYVNYNKGDTIEFIRPQFMTEPDVVDKALDNYQGKAADYFLTEVLCLANTYEDLINKGLPPEEARGILPNCTATRIGVTANLREWRHIFRLRLDPHAQSQIRALMLATRKAMEEKYGLDWVFQDIPSSTNRVNCNAVIRS